MSAARTAATADRARRDPASFRDPDSAVFSADDAVYRVLRPRGLANWRALEGTRFFPASVAAGRIIATEELGLAETLPGVDRAAAAVLQHERLPFVSYPYEWSFGMLKDAALLELDLLLEALAEGLVLKDATPYNVQWRGTTPVFIDVGSFAPLEAGRPWDGYRQFCMQFLNPLLLNAHKEVDFQPLLRGRLEGVSPQQCRNLMSGRDLVRRGVFGHVWLHSRLDRRYANRREPIAKQLERAGFRPELIVANVRGLRALVSALEWKPPRSGWSRYARDASYQDGDDARKLEFTREVLRTRRWPLVWDLGCNDGRYSRLARESAEYVVAIDGDHAVAHELYRTLRAERSTSILPLVVNLADPSPNLGWRGLERSALEARGRPTLVLCLALVHHLALTANVPINELVAWLGSLGAHVVIEFVSPEDPMARELLARKAPGVHDDYDRTSFERQLSSAFIIERRQELADGTRTLYFARPRV